MQIQKKDKTFTQNNINSLNLPTYYKKINK